MHSLFRWLVLVAMITSIYRASTGVIKSKPFETADNALRHWTATIAHIQLTIGVILYTKSPLVQFFWKNDVPTIQHIESRFFGQIHIILMAISVLILTVGSGLTKRKSTSKEKYRTMLLWFGIAFIVLIAAIPWPFSPLASRPYLRTF